MKNKKKRYFFISYLADGGVAGSADVVTHDGSYVSFSEFEDHFKKSENKKVIITNIIEQTEEDYKTFWGKE